jgi:hypothetical protein
LRGDIADNITVEHSPALKQHLRVGLPVRAIFYTAKGAVPIKAAVRSLDPVSLMASSNDSSLVADGNRVLVVFYDRKRVFRSEGKVNAVSHKNGEWFFEITDENFEQADRRRFDRYVLSALVELVLIGEGEDGESSVHHVHGETLDLSVGGAWVLLEEDIKEGTLVEFKCSLSNSDTLRVLGMVVQRKKGQDGVGIEFVDYLGNARDMLHQYLVDNAA